MAEAKTYKVLKAFHVYREGSFIKLDPSIANSKTRPDASGKQIPNEWYGNVELVKDGKIAKNKNKKAPSTEGGKTKKGK